MGTISVCTSNFVTALTHDLFHVPVVVWVMFAVLYLWTGRQTFWVIMLADPDPRGCEVAWSVRRGQFPKPVFFAFLLLWPILMAAGWVAAKLSAEEVR
jgi:hypothetical protein